MKPLYVDSLNAWVGHLPADVEADIEEIAPMIKVLGYSTSRDPYYGRPDWEVTEKYNKWLATQDPEAVKNAPPELTEGKYPIILYTLLLYYPIEDKDVAKDERDKIRKQIKENTSNNPRLNTSRRKSQVLQALKSQANQLPPHFDKRNNF